MGVLNRGKWRALALALSAAAAQAACSLITPLDFIGDAKGDAASPVTDARDEAEGASPARDAAEAAQDVSPAPDATEAGDGASPSIPDTNDASDANEAGLDAPADLGVFDAGDGGTCDAGALQNDPLNCGACGHNCLGGPCQGGMCQPVMLATGLSGVEHLALDNDNIYVTRWNSPETNGQIIQIPKTGGLSNVLTQGQLNPLGIAVDATYVYWANFGPQAGGSGSVAKVTKSGGPASVIAPNQSSNGHGSFVVAVDSNNVYWGNYFQVMSCPLSGCSDAGPAPPSSAGGVNAIATSAGVVYWTEGDGRQVSMILSTNIGGAAAPLASSPTDRPFGLALDTTFVYWTNLPGGTVARAPLGGGASPQTVAASSVTDAAADSLANMAVDDSYVYWIDRTALAIMRAPKAGGGTAAALANYGGADCRDIAVDSVAVYFTCDFSGYVAKLAK